MAVLTALTTHLGPDLVELQLRCFRAVAPEARFVVCHGGRRSDFDRLAVEDAIFVDDPSLRGPNDQQSYNGVIRAVYETYVRDDAAIDLVYFIEFDHLILRGDFERALTELAASSNAGLFAKNAGPRDDANWSHLLKVRHNASLNGFFAEISRRDDPGRRWGCLADGLLFRRDSLAAFCSVPDAPHAYAELIVPSVVYHLGFEIGDVDRLCDLYTTVRWRPPYSCEEAIAARRDGRTFIHPFKRLGALAQVYGIS